MPISTTTDFAKQVQSFLCDYLPSQRNYSRNTINSYRDTLRLFVRFLIEEKHLSIARFHMKDFTRELVLEFLKYIGLSCRPSTVNNRLSSLKSFATFCQSDCMDELSSLLNVTNIKQLRTEYRTVRFLDKETVSQVINLPDISDFKGLRHRVILCTLYDTGARVQELCDITMKDLYLDSKTPRVTLHGKGSKTRTVPITSELSTLLKAYLKRLQGPHALPDSWLVINKSGGKMTRDGVDYIVKKYFRLAFPNSEEQVHPHVFRHSKASHLLASGVPIVYIRDFLGHADLETTMIYAKADTELKSKAINALAPKIVGEGIQAEWNIDGDLMDFLSSV